MRTWMVLVMLLLVMKSRMVEIFRMWFRLLIMPLAIIVIETSIRDSYESRGDGSGGDGDEER